MICSLVLFENEFINIVSISFTALVLNELIMVAVEVQTWHTLMILSEVVTLVLYVVSILFLPEYFGQSILHLDSLSFLGTNTIPSISQISHSFYRHRLFGRLP